MKTLFTLVILYLLNVAGCNKNDSAQPANAVSVTASVVVEGVPGGGGTNYYWATVASFNKTIPDSAYVVYQWDMLNGTGGAAGTMKDTIMVAANQSGAMHRTTTIAPAGWVSTNGKITAAWSKSGSYTFFY
jgi:hypothetical protein